MPVHRREYVTITGKIDDQGRLRRIQRGNPVVGKDHIVAAETLNESAIGR